MSVVLLCLYGLWLQGCHNIVMIFGLVLAGVNTADVVQYCFLVITLPIMFTYIQLQICCLSVGCNYYIRILQVFIVC